MTLRIFGFHHAGGGVTAFSGWQSALGPDVEVVPVSLPGRGPDGRSTRYHDMTSLVAALAEDLGPRLAEPHLFYGHSMGALVAYRLADLRVRQGMRGPERLLVGAFAAPHLAHPLRRAHGLSDEQLARWLLDLSAIPASLLDSGRRAELLARLRADLRLCATHSHRTDTAPVLSCPIDVFAGTRDPLVPVTDAAQWRRYSTAVCAVHTVAGGHFFPRESKSTFFSALRAVVLPEISQPVCN